MKKTTQELFDLLSKNKDFDKYIEENNSELITRPLHVLLEDLLEKKQLSKSECIAVSGLDRIYAYQIFSGQKNPSRDKLIALCFGLHCNLDEAQTLLKHASYAPLYPRNNRDCAIIYAITHSLSIIDLNELLYEIEETLL